MEMGRFTKSVALLNAPKAAYGCCAADVGIEETASFSSLDCYGDSSNPKVSASEICAAANTLRQCCHQGTRDSDESQNDEAVLCFNTNGRGECFTNIIPTDANFIINKKRTAPTTLCCELFVLRLQIIL